MSTVVKQLVIADGIITSNPTVGQILTTDVATSAITYAKLQNESAHTLLGNPTGSAAAPSEITLGAGLSFSGTTLTATGSGGTVTTVSVVTANGVSGSVANPTTTPAITLTLGDITPSSVAASGTVTGSNLSGTNTGDQTVSTMGATGALTDGTGTLLVTHGGSGAVTLTNHGVLLGQGTSAIVASAAMTDGQLLVGQTGADPLPKTITGVLAVSAAGATAFASGAAANPSASVGLTAVNGSAGTFLRSDGAPALSQAIIPTWTGAHAFTAGISSTPPGTGVGNEAYGFLALVSNTSGQQNVAVGYETLLSNTSGSFNVAAGLASMLTNSLGSANTAAGYHSLYFSNGDANVGTGYSCGPTLTSGSGNTLIGANTDVAVDSQNYGVAIGYLAVCAANQVAFSPYAYSVLVQHLVGATSAPSVSAGTGAGTHATVSVAGTDLAGTITVNTSALDTPSASATIVTLTFAVTCTSNPVVIVSPSNDAAWALAYSVVRCRQGDVTTTTFTLRSGTTPLPASTAATYTFNYHCIQ